MDTADLWDEWLLSPVSTKYQADLEASGILLGMKNFTTKRLRAARRLTGPGKIKLWPLTSYSQTFPLSITMTTSLTHKISIKFSCPPKILKLPKNHKSSWIWLKGLWGSTGNLYFPKAGYYLALNVSNKAIYDLTRKILKFTDLSWHEHKNQFTLRNYDDITTFLCNIGLPESALEFDGVAMMRSLRSRANLVSNYDNANIARTLKASHEQIELAKKIIALGIFDSLPENLKELINVRLQYPDESLSGLGKKLMPQITKATVKYRWSKIKNLIIQS